MRTKNSASTRSTPLVTSRMATPPPTPMLDLRDGDTDVGWIEGNAIGFRGFGTEADAAHAAWVAHRTVARRFARESGRRPPPIDTEPLSIGRSGDLELILASGRPIATLLRPGVGSRRGPESFGFELVVPVRAEELKMRAIAYLVNRALRRSGIRWDVWAPLPSAAVAPDGARTDTRESSTSPKTPPRPGAGSRRAAGPGGGMSGAAATAVFLLAMLAVIVSAAITTSSLIYVLGGAAALIALGALASLVRLVAMDVRDALQARRGTPPGNVGGRRFPAAAWPTRLQTFARARARAPLTAGDVIRSAS